MQAVALSVNPVFTRWKMTGEEAYSWTDLYENPLTLIWLHSLSCMRDRLLLTDDTAIRRCWRN